MDTIFEKAKSHVHTNGCKSKRQITTQYWQWLQPDSRYLATHGEGARAALEDPWKCSLRVRENFIALSFLQRNMAMFRTDWQRMLRAERLGVTPHGQRLTPRTLTDRYPGLPPLREEGSLNLTALFTVIRKTQIHKDITWATRPKPYWVISKMVPFHDT